MDYRQLGKTGVTVPRLWLGCANIGSGTNFRADWDWTIDDPEQSTAMIDAAFERGVSALDTANFYSQGESESIVGAAIRDRREKCFLATKVGLPMSSDPNDSGLSRRHVLAQAEASLDRLGTSHVDLYQCHTWDDGSPIVETLSAMADLVDRGAVRYVGLGNCDGWQLLKAVRAAEQVGLDRIATVQLRYNLLNRGVERELLPACEDQDIGVLAYSPLATGFFAGGYDRGFEPPAGSRLERLWEVLDQEAHWETLDRVESLAAEKDATPAQIATAWVLHQEEVTAVITGPSTVGELEDSVGALEITLTAEEQAHLEEPVTADRRTER